MKNEKTPTTNTAENKTDLIPLSAAAFIDALQGKTVSCQKGKQHCFLRDDNFWEKIVEIDKVVVYDDIEIKQGLVFEYPIYIKSGEFKYEFTIFGGDFKNWFQIRRGEFKDEFNIFGGKFKKWFRISSSEFESGFSISGGEFKEEFKVSGGEFKDEFKIYGGEFKNTFVICGGEFSNEFNIFNNGGLINELAIGKELNFLLKIHPNSNINILSIENNISKEGNIDINDITLNLLNINNCKNFGLITLTDVKFEARKIYELKSGEYQLTKNKQPSLIHINNSLIGNTKFQSVDFESADKIIIDNTDINDASIRGKYFPTSVKKVFSNEEDERKKARLADIYNDLANMMKRQGNKRMELNYTATYQQLLRQSLHPIKKFEKDIIDYIPLWLGWISSNNGTNWGWAFLFTLGLPFLIFIPYTWAKGVYAFCSDCPFYESLLLGVQNYLEFAFPNIFKMSFDEPTLLALLLSILGKLVFAYGVYQFVLSFRRLGRR